MTDSTLLALPYLDAAQSQKHITHNEALAALDLIVYLRLVSMEASSPPGSPVEGERYHVGISPTGAFQGHSGQIAGWQDNAWRFLSPRPGWIAWVEDAQALKIFNGSAWLLVSETILSLANLDRLGVGASADATNPLVLKANSALFTARAAAEGGSGDLRFVLNKTAASQTLSQLYQSNYSGRAETGLIGDDHFRIKVSPDGSAWKNAIDIDPASGLVSFPSGYSGTASGLSLKRVDVFATSGIFTKQSGDALYFLQATGGGGGGGSGARSAPGSAAGGGGSGSAGFANEMWLAADHAGASLAVTVGAGGNGGASAADSTPGNAGGNGGTSYFGNFLRAEGGIAGGGGSSANGGTSSQGTYDIDNMPVARTGGANGGLAGNGASSWNSARSSAGGGGGGVSSANVAFSGGTAGRAFYRHDSMEVLGGAGAAAAVNGGNGNAASNVNYGFGSGGGGGGGGVSADAGNGGSGGSFGGGGGGGGGGRNGFGGGSGGNGGSGMVRVFVFG